MFTVARLGIDGRLAKTLTPRTWASDDLHCPLHQPQRHPMARRTRYKQMPSWLPPPTDTPPRHRPRRCSRRCRRLVSRLSGLAVVEEVVGGLGPDEGAAAFVPAVDECADGGDQVFDAAEAAEADGLAGADREEDLDRVRPRAAGRRRWDICFPPARLPGSPTWTTTWLRSRAVVAPSAAWPSLGRGGHDPALASPPRGRGSRPCGWLGRCAACRVPELGHGV